VNKVNNNMAADSMAAADIAEDNIAAVTIATQLHLF
jgi:hypothetical protein